MHRLRIAILVLFLLSSSLAFMASVAGAASKAPSGNRAAISFYRSVVAATKKTAGVRVVETGFTYMHEDPTTNRVHWLTATGRTPAGYVPATDELFVVFRGGKVAWVSDVLSPRSCPAGNARCNWSPFDLLLSSNGLRGRLESLVSNCWSKDHGSVAGFTSVGGPAGYRAFGRFAKLRHANGKIVVTSTYPWTKNQRASEIDTVAPSTRLPTNGLVRIDGAKGTPGFSFNWTNQWMTAAPALPPAPLC